MAIASEDALHGQYDVCVIGSGPVGLACAFECVDRGLSVLVLDAGGRKPVPGDPDILAADLVRTDFHDSTEITTAAALGGTSHWWGGRCMPLDPVDFTTWPITFEEMQPWWKRAGDFLGVGPVNRTPAPGAFAKLRQFDAEGSESWSTESNMSRRFKTRIDAPGGPDILLNARVTGLTRDESGRASIQLRCGDKDNTLTAGQIVIAGGGLGTMRLMLLAQRQDPSLFGGPDGPLGRGYVGHMTGYIASLVPTDASVVPQFCVLPLPQGGVSRRRILARTETVLDNDLVNISFWLDAPPILDPEYGWAAGSVRYLAASTFKRLKSGAKATEPLGPHIRNVLRAPISALIGSFELISHMAKVQFLGRAFPVKLPRKSKSGGWLFKYHAEHKPDPYNRVTLSDDVDSVGLPKLKIDFRMRDEDIDAIVRAHDIFDADLRAAGAGHLAWTVDVDKRAERVKTFASDGYHQMGGVNMSASPETGVVDVNCKVYGLDNLWVASSAIFPTGGQANPTLSAVAFAQRLANHLADLKGASGETVSKQALEPVA